MHTMRTYMFVCGYKRRDKKGAADVALKQENRWKIGACTCGVYVPVCVRTFVCACAIRCVYVHVHEKGAAAIPSKEKKT